MPSERTWQGEQNAENRISLRQTYLALWQFKGI